jgi:polyhydroxyalkanoate synthesis regulator phasin
MAFFNTLKDAAVGQAMKFASSPRVTKLVSDPRLMNAAMKAMSFGGAVKANLDKATRLAAGAFGIATQEEVASLRSTIQNLEDQVAMLESRSRSAPPTP